MSRINLKSRTFWLITILGIGLIARGLFFSQIFHLGGADGFVAPQNEDAGEYLQLAKNLSYGVFSRETVAPYAPERFRTPGYPVFVAITSGFGKNILPTIIIQNILFVAFIGLLFFHLHRFFGRWPSVIPSLFLALDPTIIYWNNQLVTETLFTILFCCGIFFLLDFLKNWYYSRLLWSLIFIVASVYVRPISLYVPVAYAAILLIAFLLKQIDWRKLLISFLILVSVVTVGLLPWKLRNNQQFGTPFFATAVNIGVGKYLTAITNELGIDLGPVSMDPGERIKVRREQFIQYAGAHPLIFLKVHITSLVPFLIGDGYMNSLSAVMPSLKSSILITDWKGSGRELFAFLKNNLSAGNFIFIFGKIIWTLIITTSVLGLYFTARRKNLQEIILFAALVVIIYYFALASGIGSYSRFRYPVNPLIFILVASGLAQLPYFKKEN